MAGCARVTAAQLWLTSGWCVLLVLQMAHRKTSGFTWALDPGREALQKAGALDFKTASVGFALFPAGGALLLCPVVAPSARS